MLRVGLTGGIASGKSSVAEMFARHGARVIDTDLIARAVVEPGTPGLAAVRAAFGATIIAPDGTLDRRKLRGMVFADAASRARLEAILHPMIRARLREELEGLHADYVIIVVPLLIETNFAALVDRILVVDCPAETQLERLMRRDAMSRSEAHAMLAAQVDRSTRREAADDVIDNSGTLEQTHAQVAALHDRYSALGQDCSSPRGRAE